MAKLTWASMLFDHFMQRKKVETKLLFPFLFNGICPSEIVFENQVIRVKSETEKEQNRQVRAGKKFTHAKVT